MRPARAKREAADAVGAAASAAVEAAAGAAVTAVEAAVAVAMAEEAGAEAIEAADAATEKHCSQRLLPGIILTAGHAGTRKEDPGRFLFPMNSSGI